MTEFSAPVLATRENMQQLFEEINYDRGLKGDTEILAPGPHTWAAVNHPGDESAQLVTRLQYDVRVRGAHNRAQRNLRLHRHLRSQGAQLPDEERGAWIVPVESRDNVGFVGTQAEYLPEGNVDSIDYGFAIGTLHRASLHVNTHNLPLVDPLRTEAPVGEIIDFLDARSGNVRFRIGETAVRLADLVALKYAYENAYIIYDQLMEAAQRNGSPMVVLQEDTHDENVRYSKDGVAKLLDIWPHKGPAAIDFGRARNDWVQHFGADPAYRDGYFEGYCQVMPLPSEQELRLAADYTQQRSSILLAAIAIKNARLGIAFDEELLKIGLHRLHVIGDRNASWRPFDSSLKETMRSQD